MIEIKNSILTNVESFKNIYVMSDLHGCRNEFYKMLKKINFNEKEDLLIILGDVIDRGPDGITLLQELLNKENTILLKGNHEDMMVKSMMNDFYWFENWTKYNGGNETFNTLSKLEKKEQNKLLAKTNNLPCYLKISINNNLYVLVHAGLSLLKNMPLDKLLDYSGSNLLWTRKNFLKSKVKTDFTVIFGHTITGFIPFEITQYPKYYKKNLEDKELILKDIQNSVIWKTDNKIGIDCGIAYGGKLACLNLKDMNEFYVND